MNTRNIGVAAIGSILALSLVPATALASTDLGSTNKKASQLAAKYKVKEIDTTIDEGGNVHTSMPATVSTNLYNMPSYGSLYRYYRVADLAEDNFKGKQLSPFVRYRFKGDGKWRTLGCSKASDISKSVKVASGKTVEYQLRFTFYTIESTCRMPMTDKYKSVHNGKWSKTFSWKNKQENTVKWRASIPQLAFVTDKAAAGKANGKSDKKNLADAKKFARQLSGYAPAKLDKSGIGNIAGSLTLRVAQNDNVLKKLPATGAKSFGRKYYVVVDSLPPVRYKLKGDKEWIGNDGLQDKDIPTPIQVGKNKTVQFQMKTRAYVCQRVGNNEDDFWDDGVGGKEQDKVLAVYTGKWSKTYNYKNTSGQSLSFSGPTTFCR